jgi:glycosyltransferase involved in cell wall biosynthesis
MRVLVTASTFPSHPDDGSPRFVYDLCEALARRCEVAALVPDAPGAARRERMGRVEVHRFTYFLPRRVQGLAYGDGIAANLAASPRVAVQALPYLVAQATATRALVRRLGIDVVSSHWVLPQGLAAAIARGRARRRFAHVATLHGGDAHLLRRLPLVRRIAGFVAARTDAWIAVSASVRDALDAALGRASGAAIQPMGVALERFGLEAPAPPGLASGFPGGFVLYAGRLARIKGVEHLLRALPRVFASHPGLGACIVGSGPAEPGLRAEAARLGISDRVRFEGRLPQAEVARRLRACRAAVVPSVTRAGGRSEGMPTIVAEALAAGAPLVATSSGGIPELVRHGENGWLCRERDPGDLAEKLLAALADRSPGRAPRAREAARALDWERVADRYLEVMRRACERPPRSGSLRARA